MLNYRRIIVQGEIETYSEMSRSKDRKTRNRAIKVLRALYTEEAEIDQAINAIFLQYPHRAATP
jgi:hypothetical protein